jgi:hypothetical protein
MTMTLIEYLEAPADRGTIPQRLAASLRTVPGALALAVSHWPTGTRALLAIDGPSDSFFEAESAAAERLFEIRRDFPDNAIDLLCVSAEDASTFELSPEATVFDFR